MYSKGQLIGDLGGKSLQNKDVLIFATLLVVTSYLIILGPLFHLLNKIKIKPIQLKCDNRLIGDRLGLVLVTSQLTYLIFNLSTGVNIAGSNTTNTDSAFSFFWVLFPVDSLFLIYYGFYRESTYFKPNLILWLLSNTLRGWGSIWLTITFLEWCRAVTMKKLKLIHVILIAPIVAALYPLLTSLKWGMRASSSLGLSLDTLFDAFFSNLNSDDYLTLMSEGLEHLVGRLQSVSFLVDVIELKHLLQIKFLEGDFSPFWKEGLHGYIYDRLFSETKQQLIGVAFTKYEDFGFVYEIGDWNVSLGYPSWFFICPEQIPLYIIYTLSLSYTSLYLLKKIGQTPLAIDMLWYTWLIYLLAPWFLTFTAFIYALFVFIFLTIFLSEIPKLRFKFK